MYERHNADNSTYGNGQDFAGRGGSERNGAGDGGGIDDDRHFCDSLSC